MEGSWRNQRPNHKNVNENDQNHEKISAYRTNQVDNSENNPTHFQFGIFNTGKSRSNNRQELFGKNRNSVNEQKRWQNKQNSENNPTHFQFGIFNTGKSRSNNRQELFGKNRNSVNEQKRWQNKQNSFKINSDINGINDNKDIPKFEKKNKYFGFKHLEELCNTDPTEIIFVMSNETNGFMDLFKLNKNPDWIFLLMKISAKICSTEFNQNKIALLTELTCNQFFDQLKGYILKTPTETNSNRCKNIDEFFNDCLVVFQSILSLFPKTAIERLKEIVISSNIAIAGIKNYNNNIKINDTTIVNMNKLLQEFNAIKLTDELKLKEKLILENNAQYHTPPENFRELSIYPTAIDLEFGEPFLRPNISKGVYQSVEHYLDVQFRLLREDFIGPLREAITLYKENMNNRQQKNIKEIDNIHVYREVQFEKKDGLFVHDKNGYLIHFDKKKKLNINWEVAKRFMCGSLLLFTENEFRTFFMGVVLESKSNLLKHGKIIVELLKDAKPIYNKSLIMVESEIFFEPYKCSMEVLKTITSYNFPMEKYIISACNYIDYPHYIDSFKNNFSIGEYNFNILNSEDWPTNDDLELDMMQYRAFKAALTHEFTVIQGPPGTGKTHIGLKIIKNIIDNLYTSKSNSVDYDYDYDTDHYDVYDPFVDNICLEMNKLSIHNSFLTKPILVVCYTNHALDQFMEGVLKITKKIVRIGGQSKSETIQQYSLKNVTSMYRRLDRVKKNKRYINTNSGLRYIYEKLNSIKSEMNDCIICRDEIMRNKGVLEISLLKNGMPRIYHDFFQTTKDLLSWLFQDNHFSIDPVVFIEAYCHMTSIFDENTKSYLINNEYNDDIDDDRYFEENLNTEYNLMKNSDAIHIITLDDMNNACITTLNQIKYLETQSNLSVNSYNYCEELKFNLNVMEKIYDYFVNMMSLFDAEINLPNSIENPYMLDMKQRWALYFRWVENTKVMYDPKILYYEQLYKDVYKQLKELQELENIEILNKMHVIALTTTGAAKRRTMLEGLASPIVIVEEAAEVLESHIVTTLTKHCQHLILIGDHKQLRPSNAVYKLANDFNFDISLFERMVNNDVPCYTLGEQHRMRPEFASLLTPTIYPELKNNISVYNRDHVLGVCKDLFFLDHNVYENDIAEISSKSNEHEATFLIMFARHLLLQGYTSNQVTILTTYKGQLFKLLSLRKNHPILEDIRITVVDNYQGEESDIILLSLVRSNQKGNIGFLKTENRICVALSRAKYGLYIMGNMDNLCNSGSLWKKIKGILVGQDSYGDELSLECSIHSGIITKVSKSEDFNMILEGGCTMPCESLLICGHYCASICHSYDREHIDIKCREPCNKSCPQNHQCTKLCYMDCDECSVSILKELPCGHRLELPCSVDSVTFPCNEKVETVLDNCGHMIIKECHEKNPNCTYKCLDQLDCGHACELNCHKNGDPDHKKYKCLKPCKNINGNCSLNHKCQKLCYEDCLTCYVKCEKILPCGHIKNDVPCGLNINDIKCYFPCDRLLGCNHKCQAKCYELCKDCEVKVKKIIPECGHSISIACSSVPEHKNCTRICEQIRDCGHKCKDVCAKPCNSNPCEEMVLQKTSELACGHDKVMVLCCDKNNEFSMDSQYLLDKCQEPCLQKLNCNHICMSTCGQCKQGRIHMPCMEICNKINPCNHTCKLPCKERCPPCNKKCQNSCVHSKCTLNCGDACIPCEEECNWQCPHLKCTKKCFEICNRKACYEPCKIMLQCGHRCIGFCGEPCPPFCRICQNDEIMSIICNTEDDPNARFVYLEDCGHTIESKALEKWLNQNNDTIALKQCPVCKTPILRTQRFMNQAKVILGDLSKIKTKQYTELAVINGYKKKVLNSLFVLNKGFNKMFISDDRNQFNSIKDLWEKFCLPLLLLMNSEGKQFQNHLLTAKDIESLEFVIHLFKSISKYKSRISIIRNENLKQVIINHFIWLISVAFTFALNLSYQQKIDINIEMIRGTRILSVFEIISSSEFMMVVISKTDQSMEVKTLVDQIQTLLMSYKKYNLISDEKAQHFIKLIKQKIQGNSLVTNKKEEMIHKATSVNFHEGVRSQGPWCKCSKGHIYCITQCEGPMEKSVCPECKVEITGTNHTYVSGTSVGSEMDGFRRMMWRRGGNNMKNCLL